MVSCTNPPFQYPAAIGTLLRNTEHIVFEKAKVKVMTLTVQTGYPSYDTTPGSLARRDRREENYTWSFAMATVGKKTPKSSKPGRIRPSLAKLHGSSKSDSILPKSMDELQQSDRIRPSICPAVKSKFITHVMQNHGLRFNKAFNLMRRETGVLSKISDDVFCQRLPWQIFCLVRVTSIK